MMGMFILSGMTGYQINARHYHCPVESKTSTSQNIYDTICQRRYMEIRYSDIEENISQNDSYVTCDAIVGHI